jgi:hypothetical protein
VSYPYKFGTPIPALDTDMTRLTYSEIYNEVYGNDQTLAELCVTPAHAAAWMILVKLNNRKGFDAWWEGLDSDEIRNEIFAVLVKIIENHFLTKS